MKRFISIILLFVYLGMFVMIGVAMIPKPQKRNYAPIIQRNMYMLFSINESKEEETLTEQTSAEITEETIEFVEPIETTEVNAEITEEVIVEETNSNVYNNDFVDNTYAEKPENYRTLYVTAYAYCPCMKCCGKTNGITATGTQAIEGRTIAVDPNVIPYGSKVLINDKVYIAEDCGGFRGNVIDVFHNTHEKALQFGRKNIEIIIYQ